ncbi:MAG: hypothetical protein M1813_000605 [Trichoglossum hirsutum]|nr:MAG: hypothetical protein M1813_000605 [Trichoglossum hirsutum]
MPSGPQGAPRYDPPEPRFPGFVIVGSSAIGGVLVGRRKWTDPQAMRERDILLGGDDDATYIYVSQALTAPGKDTGYSRNGSDPPAPLSRMTWYKGAETSVEPDAANPIQDDDCRLVLIYGLEHSDT